MVSMMCRGLPVDMGPLHKELFSLFKMEKRVGGVENSEIQNESESETIFFESDFNKHTCKKKASKVAELLNCSGNSHILSSIKKR